MWSLMVMHSSIELQAGEASVNWGLSGSKSERRFASVAGRSSPVVFRSLARPQPFPPSSPAAHGVPSRGERLGRRGPVRLRHGLELLLALLGDGLEHRLVGRDEDGARDDVVFGLRNEVGGDYGGVGGVVGDYQNLRGASEHVYAAVAGDEAIINTA